MEIEYIDEGHIYLCDGVIIPSVSELLRFIFPDKYTGIPERILSEKAQFGTNIHKAIEDYENGLEIALTGIEEIVFEQYLKVKAKYNIKVREQEKLVCWQGRYAGRLDMIAEVDGKRYLIDIKTTAKLDHVSLMWQLSYYQMASGEKFDGLACLWLPKNDIGRFIGFEEIPEKELRFELMRFETLNDTEWGCGL